VSVADSALEPLIKFPMDAMLPFVNAPNPTTPRVTLLLSYANRAVAWMDRVARHKILMCLLATATVMVIRIVLLPWIPIPKPFITIPLRMPQTRMRGTIGNP
jgi:hypothetical protein